MTAAVLVSTASMSALAILALAFLLTVYRVVAGPTLPDRVLALDMLVAIAIGFIAVVAIKTGFALYIDIAISLGLVGFLATVAFARFILTHSAAQPAGPVDASQAQGNEKGARRSGPRTPRSRGDRKKGKG